MRDAERLNIIDKGGIHQTKFFFILVKFGSGSRLARPMIKEIKENMDEYACKMSLNLGNDTHLIFFFLLSYFLPYLCICLNVCDYVYTTGSQVPQKRGGVGGSLSVVNCVQVRQPPLPNGKKKFGRL